MIKNRLIKNLKSPTYYFSQVFGSAAYVFLIVLWIFLRDRSNLGVTNTQIVMYFITIYSFNYLFTFNFVDAVVARLKEKSELFWLNPTSALRIFFSKDFLPIIIDNLPLAFLSVASSLALQLISPQALILFLGLIILTHICHFFLSITFALLKFYLRWEWVSFSLRYIGLTWNGSYLPLIFFKGIFYKILIALPFLHSGLAIQLLLNEQLNVTFLLNVLVFTLIFVLTSLYMLHNFKKFQQN
ncbi:MAG: hypothetical protein PHS44_00015 [Candidatus Dojkabacteria bacterium]|nr:hypothetical protein [Candidatus Dojkabacteria bacterium]